MDLSGFLRYWSLTLAVFVFYLFAIIVASLDIVGEVGEAVRKRRAASRGPALDPNPLVNRTVAETMLSGPGQRPDAKREWVAHLAKEVAGHLNAPVQTLVLEDSKGHPLVHFNDGKRVQTYRIERSLVESAMAGDTAKVRDVSDLLTRHLMADFLGMETFRPPQTTELGREAASKPAPAATQPVPTTSPAPGTPSAPAAPAGAEMSREERLAQARAKAEELKARARQQQKSPQ